MTDPHRMGCVHHYVYATKEVGMYEPNVPIGCAVYVLVCTGCGDVRKVRDPGVTI